MTAGTVNSEKTLKVTTMRLSVSFNFFNGEEHLYAAVRNIRPVVDHISIVYQTISNYGLPISPSAYNVLNRLIAEGLIDEVFHYRPDFNRSATVNEYEKRKTGFRLALEANATHFLLMDSDEFYIRDEFISAKKMIEI